VGDSPTFFFVHEMKVFQDGTSLPGYDRYYIEKLENWKGLPG